MRDSEIADLLDAAAEIDGYSALNEAARLHLRHRRPGIEHVVVERDGRVVGYGQLDADFPPTAAMVVHPDYRRQGIGTQILRRLLAHSDGPLQIWAMTNSPAAAALAARTDLDRVRTLLLMSRTLSDALPAVPPPPDVTIRAFVPGQDETAWLAVNAAAFAEHPEQGSVDAGDLAERMAEPWFDPHGFLLAERDGRLVGFHWTKVHSPQRGEVYVLGVAPAASGAGLGRALLAAGLHHLQRRGCRDVVLYVEADHATAVQLYLRSGFRTVSTDVLYRRRHAEHNVRDGADAAHRA